MKKDLKFIIGGLLLAGVLALAIEFLPGFIIEYCGACASYSYGLPR